MKPPCLVPLPVTSIYTLQGSPSLSFWFTFSRFLLCRMSRYTYISFSRLLSSMKGRELQKPFCMLQFVTFRIIPEVTRNQFADTVHLFTAASYSPVWISGTTMQLLQLLCGRWAFELFPVLCHHKLLHEASCASVFSCRERCSLYSRFSGKCLLGRVRDRGVCTHEVTERSPPCAPPVTLWPGTHFQPLTMVTQTGSHTLVISLQLP